EVDSLDHLNEFIPREIQQTYSDAPDKTGE
ncbi:MAG: hypothetical protein ACI82F_004425, partial [Planctomycetota bacterium]